MVKKIFLFLSFLVGLPVLSGTSARAQQGAPPPINVTVDLVQLNVAATDSKGNYITGLRPQDFVITEDTIPEDIAIFGEGDESVRALPDKTSSGANPPDTPLTNRRNACRLVN